MSNATDPHDPWEAFHETKANAMESLYKLFQAKWQQLFDQEVNNTNTSLDAGGTITETIPEGMY
jgi:hypothetical protein